MFVFKKENAHALTNFLVGREVWEMRHALLAVSLTINPVIHTIFTSSNDMLMEEERETRFARWRPASRSPRTTVQDSVVGVTALNAHRTDHVLVLLFPCR